MNLRGRKRALASMSASVVALLQMAAAQTTDSPDDGLEQIVVTAQKRTEQLQQVPLAVTAITADQLQRDGVTSFTDLVKVSPAFTFQQGDQPGNATLYLRGVGTTGSSVGIEPSVSAQIDDFPAGFRQNVFTDLIDVERVEVLRGPQSTLYGKGASAGLINIITKAPSPVFTALAQAGGTSDGGVNAQAMMSGPLLEGLAFRSSVVFNNWNGNVKNLYDGSEINGQKQVSGRTKLVWSPDENFVAAFTINYNRQDNNCCTPVLTQTPAILAGSPASYYGNAVNPVPVLGGIPGKTLGAELPGIVPGPKNHYVYADNPPYQYGGDISEGLRLTHLIGDYELSLILSNSQYNLDDGVDADFTSDPSVKVVQTGFTKATSQSYELRLTSPSDRPLRFVAGNFAEWIDAERYLKRVSNTQAVGAVQRSVSGAGDYDAYHYNRDFASFAQAEYDLLDGVTATGGVRYQRSAISYAFDDYLNKRFYPVDPNRNFAVPGSSASDAVTGRGALQYQLDSNIMLYGSYASGFKGGAFDITSSWSDALAKAGPVLPEYSRSFEIGARTQLFNRHLTLNETLFDTHISDFQARAFDPTLGLTFLTNIHQVETKGVETDAAAALGNGVTLNANFAYTDALSTNWTNASCYPNQTTAQGCITLPGTTTKTQDLSGKVLPNAPRWKGNFGVSYNHETLLPDWTGTATILYTYQSKVNYSPLADPSLLQKAYGILNFGYVLHDVPDQLTVSFNLNNVLNQLYYTYKARAVYYYTNAKTVSTDYQVDAAAGILPRNAFRFFGLTVGKTF